MSPRSWITPRFHAFTFARTLQLLPCSVEARPQLPSSALGRIFNFIQLLDLGGFVTCKGRRRKEVQHRTALCRCLQTSGSCSLLCEGLFVFHPLIIEVTDVGVVLHSFTVPPLYFFSKLLKPFLLSVLGVGWGHLSDCLTGGEDRWKNTFQGHYASDFQSVAWGPVSSMQSQASVSGSWAG